MSAAKCQIWFETWGVLDAICVFVPDLCEKRKVEAITVQLLVGTWSSVCTDFSETCGVILQDVGTTLCATNHISSGSLPSRSCGQLV